MKIELETGTLEVCINRCDFAFEDLVGFAARQNPKRGFLFVSKVLGKHWPVRPSAMQEIHCALAQGVQNLNVQGPIFMVGMAETATALGRGVFEEFCARTGMDAVYTHSTRYRLGQHTVLDFAEEHSHATDQLLHLPHTAFIQDCVAQARTLVVIDDEVSTGQTICNLTKVLQSSMPHLQRLVIVTLMHMAGAQGRERLRKSAPCAVDVVSLVQGEFTFASHNNVVPSTVKSMGKGDDMRTLLASAGGRVGVLPGQWAMQHAALTHVPTNTPVLVLGTGEFMYEPYRLALDLEKAGHTVLFQSTTRSPILVEHDIQSKLAFLDNYRENIDNFLYNVRPQQYKQVIICYETPPETHAHSLVSTLDAQALHMTY